MTAEAPVVKLRAGTAALSGWRRVIIPSASDLFFVFFMLWSFLAGENGWKRLLMDSSVALQIRAGQFMIGQHAIPANDIFSFAYPGQRWYLFEWLSELLFGAVHAAWSLKGVVLVTGVVLGLTFTVLFRAMLARGVNCFIALALALIAANGASVAFMARPQIFTFGLLAVTAWMIDADRRRPKAVLWALPGITVLWTNLHGGFFILFPYLGLLVAGCLVEGWLSPEWRVRRYAEARRYASLLAACALASGINPYGFRFHRDVLLYLNDKWVVTYVHEFQSPVFRSEPMFWFMAALFVGLGVAALYLSRRRVVEPLWIVFFGYCALVSVRHTPLFLIVVAPLIASELTIWWSRWTVGLPPSSVARILDGIAGRFGANAGRTTLLVPASIALLCVAGGLAWPTDLPGEVFPSAVASRQADLIARSRVYTSDQWADYLIYENYPRQRVFMDDRHQYYSLKVRNDYLALDTGESKWKNVLDEYSIDAVLCPPNAPLASLLREHRGWRVIEEDRMAVLFALL